MEHKHENVEEKILREEKQILTEIKKEEHILRRLGRNVWFASGAMALIILGGFGAAYVWNVSLQQIYIEKSQVVAPLITLAPQNPGVLQEILVREGDQVSAYVPVARVGNELVKTQVAGTVVAVNNNVGKLFNRGETVVTMIDPNELRVVGRVEEDKGLSDIRVGQRAVFTVDAFGSKSYEGVVDEISPTSRESGVVFSISDKREVKEFDVKVRFNIGIYPELKNGMSAKLWIYK